MIHMLFNDIEIKQLKDTAPNHIFDECVVGFLNSLSLVLMKSGRAYSDVVTFAYWCRKNSIRKMSEIYLNDRTTRIGKGIVFHIAPSNVPINFAYSMVAGLLAGNVNLVRLPSRSFPQVEIIVTAIHKLLKDQWNCLKPYIHLFSYGHDKGVTDMLSSIADVRVIWGGDETISVIRQSPLRARATEIPLADRYSIFLINAEDYLLEKDKVGLAKKFYNDTLLFDQNACTSPRLVCWLGNNIESAKELFWLEYVNYVRSNYEIQELQVINKYYQLCRMAIESNLIGQVHPNNLVTRIQLQSVTKETEKFFYNSGFFLEVDIKELDELLPILTEKCQTVVYFGDIKDQIKYFINRRKPKGIDRVKPIGKSGDFSLKWDGFDLIVAMSRLIEGFDDI